MARPLVVVSTEWGIIPLWNVERNLTCFSTDSRQPNARLGLAKIDWTLERDVGPNRNRSDRFDRTCHLSKPQRPGTMTRQNTPGINV